MTDIETGAAEEQPADLRSVLAAAADEAEESAGRHEQPVTEEASAGESDGNSGEQPAGERPRGPDGKFVAKEKTERATAQNAAARPADAQNAKEAPDAEKTETGDQAASALAGTATQAPQHWSVADKETFTKLPAAAQAPFLDLYKRMEAGFTPKLQRLAAYDRDYQGVPELFAPHAEALRSQGKTPAHIIQAWAGVEQALLNHKGAVERGQAPDETAAATVARMIAGYRLDPADIARHLTGLLRGGATAPNAQQPASPRTAVDPETATRLERLERAEQERSAAVGQQRLNTAQQQIDAFAADKDGAGNPKHPFFAELEPDMMALAQLDRAMGKTPELSDLYERAVWANQDTRGKLLALQQEHEAKRAAVERKAASEAARRAAVSVAGGPGAGQAQRQTSANRSLRDTIKDAAADLDAAA